MRNGGAIIAAPPGPARSCPGARCSDPGRRVGRSLRATSKARTSKPSARSAATKRARSSSQLTRISDHAGERVAARRAPRARARRNRAGALGATPASTSSMCSALHLAAARGVGAHLAADEQQVEQAFLRVDGVDERGGERDRFLEGGVLAARCCRCRAPARGARRIRPGIPSPPACRCARSSSSARAAAGRPAGSRAARGIPRSRPPRRRATRRRAGTCAGPAARSRGRR